VGTWLSIATGTTCLIVTIVGLVLSAIAWRKKGMRSGMRGAAWSLLPLVMYLTGSIRLVGRLGSAIVAFAGSFVFSPKAWLGVILFFVAVLLFLISGGIPLLGGTRKRNKARRDRTRSQQQLAGNQQLSTPVPPARQQADMPPAASDDDLGDVQEILRRRGIK
jgi:cytochrome c oxidase assembly factor CtaG